MPEGDTIYRQAALLHRALSGASLSGADFRVPQLATLDLTGMEVSEVVSRGKHLLIRVVTSEDATGWHTRQPASQSAAPRHSARRLTVTSHLKMEGIWHVYPTKNGTARWRRPAHTARCVLSTADHTVVGFSLGELKVIEARDEAAEFAHIGPDLLGADWNAQEVRRRLASKGERTLGVALLDQRNLAGVGNVYRSEVCFLARIRPCTPVAAVTDLDRVIELCHRLLSMNKDRSRRNTVGTPGAGVDLWVYGRAGKRCLRCSARIEKSELGEGPACRVSQLERVIYWCPVCQPMPSGF